jgi:hypothetical protein
MSTASAVVALKWIAKGEKRNNGAVDKPTLEPILFI